MKYDFTSIMDRHGKDAIAVDGLGTGFAPAAPKEGFDAIPMWVADMNFPTVPTIQEAIIERTNHPGFVVTKVLVTQKGLAYLNHLFGGKPSDGKLARIV